jgi:hypothetical protein
VALTAGAVLAGPGCAAGEPPRCGDDAREASAPEQVVPGHRGTFGCIDPADFDNQLKLTFDGSGRLITTWVATGANGLGTYALLNGEVQLEDDAGWRGAGSGLVIAQGRLVRFQVGPRDCVATSLWGLCGIAGAWDCPEVQTADGPTHWSVELTADRGLMIHETGPLGERFDWGVYLVDGDDRFTLLLPRAKMAPALPGTLTAQGAPGQPLVLTGRAAGPLSCPPR